MEPMSEPADGMITYSQRCYSQWETVAISLGQVLQNLNSLFFVCLKVQTNPQECTKASPKVAKDMQISLAEL